MKYIKIIGLCVVALFLVWFFWEFYWLLQSLTPPTGNKF